MSELRCWPGCVARVIAPASPNRDRIVTCIRLLEPGEELETSAGTCEAAPPEWGPQWHVRGRLVAAGADGIDVEVLEGPISDRQLQPIRDPGDDAMDETLGWLPAPALATA